MIELDLLYQASGDALGIAPTHRHGHQNGPQKVAFFLLSILCRA